MSVLSVRGIGTFEKSKWITRVRLMMQKSDSKQKTETEKQEMAVVRSIGIPDSRSPSRRFKIQILKVRGMVTDATDT